jgi:DNA-binding HxlR family transcriptional regulator
MHELGAYCAFSKAVEHLGDRWSLLLVRELSVHGERGFNGFTECLPAISRSVLARRLRKLEDLGLVARNPRSRSPHAPYRLTPAGQQLTPTLLSLKEWAERWVPEDPAAAIRDPDVITWWLRHRVDESGLPRSQTVVELQASGARSGTVWLLLEHGVEPSICLEDPGLDPGRYVYVDAATSDLYPIARGERSWTDAIRGGSVHVYGDPALVAQLPAWFRDPGPAADARSPEPSGSRPDKASDQPPIQVVTAPRNATRRRSASRARPSSTSPARTLATAGPRSRTRPAASSPTRTR